MRTGNERKTTQATSNYHETAAESHPSSSTASSPLDNGRHAFHEFFTQGTPIT
jgi:hypothetical protein